MFWINSWLFKSIFSILISFCFNSTIEINDLDKSIKLEIAIIMSNYFLLLLFSYYKHIHTFTSIFDMFIINILGKK